MEYLTNVGSRALTPIATFADSVRKIGVPEDRPVESSQMFELTGDGPSTAIKFAGLSVGALPMYQVKAATGAANLDITGTETLLRTARLGDDRRAPVARSQLLGQVTELNAALRGSNMAERGFVMRIAKDSLDRDFIGGIVSRQYAPLTHQQYIDRMMELPGFDGALVHRWSLSPARLDFTIMLAGHEWTADGGIKCGTRGGNGQFGDKAAGLVAMLFRLLCTNGMMDVYEKSGFRRRHAGTAVDLAAELRRVIEAAGEMFNAAKISMETEIDVIAALAELYRRGKISRGAFRKCLERVTENFGGVVVSGATTTLWGLSQALTAAGRDYSFGQMQSMGQLAGEVMRHGMRNIASANVLLDDRSDWAEILNEHGHVIGRTPVEVL